MSRLPQTGDDLAVRLREIERRMAELEARARTGLLGPPTVLTSSSAATSGGTELDLGLDQTLSVGPGRDVRQEFSCRNLLGTVQQDIFAIRFKENGVQVAEFQAQVHETTAHIDLSTVRHIYTPTPGLRLFEVFLVRISGTGTAQVIAAATAPAVFTVEDAGSST